jgi:ribosomal protein S6--L-glutamate ligase
MNIVILSRNPALYSTQSLIVAARRRGHNVRVLDHMQCDIIVENGKEEILYQNERILGINAIIPRIGASATNYGAAVIRQFEGMGVFTVLSSDSLLKSRDKLSCLQILSTNNIPIPKSIISNNPLVIPEMIDKLKKMPIIIKMINGTHGLGVILSEDKKNAEAIIEAMYKAKQKLILQEFIKESDGADVRVFIVDGEIVGVMKRQAQEGEFRSNLHRGGTSFVVKLTEEEQRIALKAASILKLQVAGVDMLRSNRGPLILEVNASPGLEGIETTTKIDIAGKIIRYVERNAKTSWRR